MAPRALAAVLRRGLALKPGDRFESMTRLVDAFEEVLALAERRRVRRRMLAGSIAASSSTAALMKLLG